MRAFLANLAVIIVNYRTPALAIASFNALLASSLSFEKLRLIVVDGYSNDGSVKAIGKALKESKAGISATLLPLSINGGFAYANNCAMLQLAAEGQLPRFIALINPDAQVRPGALEAMAALLERIPTAGAVGAQLEHDDGRPQASAFTWPSLLGEFCRGARTGILYRLLGVPPGVIHSKSACKVPWVTGAAVMFRSAALIESGLFDEGFFLYFEETELMKRLTRGRWDIWHEPAARVVHFSGASTQLRDPVTGLLPSKAVPRYWYESRRRYFALVGGRGYALLASIFWLAGHLVYRARRHVVPTATDGPLSPARDMLRRGFWPRKSDLLSATPQFGAQPAATPAWMNTIR